MPEPTTEVHETTNNTVAFQEPVPVADSEPVDEVADEPEPAEDDHGDLGEPGKQAIVAEREARKTAERQLKTVERQLREVTTALKTYEDRDKTELELLRERADAAERRAVEAEQERLRQKVASEKGVPANRLAGSTEDELMAAADELIAWRDQHKPAPKRVPSPEGLKSGASGVENTNPDPKAAAAESLRRLRRHG